MKNKYEKIFRRDDGSQVKVEVSLWSDSGMRDSTMEYKYSIETRGNGKRKWFYVSSRYDGKLTPDVIIFISPAEILEAETEFWKSIKPVMREMHEGD